MLCIAANKFHTSHGSRFYFAHWSELVAVVARRGQGQPPTPSPPPLPPPPPSSLPLGVRKGTLHPYLAVLHGTYQLVLPIPRYPNAHCRHDFSVISVGLTFSHSYRLTLASYVFLAESLRFEGLDHNPVAPVGGTSWCRMVAPVGAGWFPQQVLTVTAIVVVKARGSYTGVAGTISLPCR